MKESLKIAGAFVGVIVGAGFASGRELLQMFVDFGVWGLLGAVVSAAFFTFLGMALAGLGNRQRATSHKDVIQAICGRHLGLFVDWLITFFMFAVTVVMLAGGGALLEQQFGIPALTGSVLVTLVVVGIVCLDVRKVILAIGAITPLLILVASAIALYAVFTREQSFAALDHLAGSLGDLLHEGDLVGLRAHVQSGRHRSLRKSARQHPDCCHLATLICDGAPLSKT